MSIHFWWLDPLFAFEVKGCFEQGTVAFVVASSRVCNTRLIKQQDGNVRWRREGARNSLDSVLIWPYLGIGTARVVVKWRSRFLAKSA